MFNEINSSYILTKSNVSNIFELSNILYDSLLLNKNLVEFVTSKFIAKKLVNERQAIKKLEEKYIAAKKFEDGIKAAKKLEARKLAAEVIENKKRYEIAKKATIAQNAQDIEEEYFFIDDIDLNKDNGFKPNIGYLNKIFKPKLGDQALTPSILNLRLFEQLKDLGFKSISGNDFLLKDNEISIMFVGLSFSDADPTNIYEFAMSSNRDVTMSLKSIIIHLKPHYELLGKVEVFLPYALTKELFGYKRAHWIYSHIIIENSAVIIEFIDSKSSTYRYDFTITLNEIKAALIEFKEYQFEMKIVTKGDQSIFDHISCGYYVIKYITDHARLYYQLNLENTVFIENIAKEVPLNIEFPNLLNKENYFDFTYMQNRYVTNNIDYFIEDIKSDFRNDNLDDIYYNYQIFYQEITILKTTNIIIDLFRVIKEPSLKQAKTLIRDIVHLQNILQGTNYYSIAISSLDVLNQIYYGEYTQGLIQITSIIGYVFLPVMLGQFSSAYINAISDYVKYQVFENLYSFIMELNTIESRLKFNLAYGELFYYFGFKNTSKNNFINVKDIITNLIENDSFTQEIHNIVSEHSLIDKFEELNIEYSFLGDAILI